MIRMVSLVGKWALPAKFDVEAAYQNITVHPSDCFLLSIEWHSKPYVE